MELFLEQFQFLLAGFVAAWVFYGLTPYRRPTPFERVVQALVYTAIVQLLALGLAGATGGETTAAKVFTGPAGVFALAIFIGVAFAWLTNRDYPHRQLRKLGITMQTARKCNWADAFDLDGYEFIILNLRDGRRICGWPLFWPDSHMEDHFLLRHYAWLREQDGKPLNLSRAVLETSDTILISSEAVDTVEFLFDQPIEASEQGDKQ